MTLKSGKFRSMELSENDLDTPMRTIMDFMTSESGVTIGNVSPLLRPPLNLTQDSLQTLKIKKCKKPKKANLVIVPTGAGYDKEVVPSERVITKLLKSHDEKSNETKRDTLN